MLQPTVQDFVGDPACGSGRMLTHVLEHIRQQEYHRVGGREKGINSEEPSKAFIEFRNKHLFGADISRPVMHLARVNMMMNEALSADLQLMDSLAPVRPGPGWPQRAGFYGSGLTMILTNPPFGAKIKDQRRLQDLAKDDGVALKNGKVVKSLPQEVAFLQRCLQILSPRGQLAIVLPDGILANSSMQYVRDWIMRQAKLKAVISLPDQTFAPYGTTTKTSVILLEKRRKPQGQDVTERENYEIYMARIDHIGYDARGHATDIDETTEVVSGFTELIEKTVNNEQKTSDQ